MVETGEILELLQKVVLFANLSINDLEKLLPFFKTKVFNQEETIFEEESSGNSLMIILSGKVRISQLSTSGEEALAVLEKGDFFGEMALLLDEKRSATAIAHTNTIIFEIRREDFLTFVFSNPEAGVRIFYNIARIMAQRLKETDLKIKTFLNLSQWL